MDRGYWYLAPAALVGGAVLGPFYALGNGFYYDWNYKYDWGDDLERLICPFTSVIAFESGKGWPPQKEAADSGDHQTGDRRGSR
ncbi:MAG: hypothetical protein AB7O84_13270 [Planctomycetota bacterium]